VHITINRVSQINALSGDSLAISIVDALTSNICVVDSEGVIVAVNRAWRQFQKSNSTDKSRNEIGTNYLDVCGEAAGPASEEASAFAKGMRSVLKGKKQLFQLEYPCHSPDELRWFQARVTPLQLNPSSSKAKNMGAVVSHMNITDRIRLEQNLTKLAATDPLTGLPNRRFFEDVASIELAQVLRFGKRASLLMMDIDKFKDINDTHGHAVGDEVLRNIASLSRKVVREDDLFVRFGGEEFVCLMRGTDEQGAVAVAEKLRFAIENTPIGGGSATIAVTASFGVACITADDRSIDSVLARADKALYRAKTEGRNCVRASQ
jgi:diguanylate cyclase (GGDEF)-like protein